MVKCPVIFKDEDAHSFLNDEYFQLNEDFIKKRIEYKF